MSERNGLAHDLEMLVIWILLFGALTGVFHYCAQTRDLQRRVGQLESEVRR